MALTTTAQVMTTLNIQDQTQSVRIDLLRRGMEQAIKSYCKWEIEQDTVTDYMDGNGQPDMVIRRPFVSNVSSVYQDMSGNWGQSNNAFSGNPLVQGTDWALVTEDTLSKCGLLHRITNNFFTGFPSDLIYQQQSGGLSYCRPAFWIVGGGNYKVTYTYGFPPSIGNVTAIWSGGVITYTTPVAHGLQPNMRFWASGFSPDDFNLNGSRVLLVPSPITFIANYSNQPNPTSSGVGAISGIPEDIQAAVCAAVGIFRNSVLYGGPLTSENLGDYSYSAMLNREPMFGDVRELLSQYRDLALGMV